MLFNFIPCALLNVHYVVSMVPMCPSDVFLNNYIPYMSCQMFPTLFPIFSAESTLTIVCWINNYLFLNIFEVPKGSLFSFTNVKKMKKGYIVNEFTHFVLLCPIPILWVTFVQICFFFFWRTRQWVIVAQDSGTQNMSEDGRKSRSGQREMGMEIWTSCFLVVQSSITFW
jgi:hypothetical protein